ncbi:MAG: protein kinase [Verrucomicrobia bacterium]|nr:protein kinase [Verrucomicrobiota bacterium]
MATPTATGPLTRSADALRPIHCYLCGATNFVAPGLPPQTEMPCNKCGKSILIPYLLRHFEIRQAIASGGMGTVYRAFDTILKREVAVKLMKRELGRDQKMLDEFYKEARMIAALNHPNIIQVFNFGEMDGENFIAMELADRGSVESRALKNGGRISELEVLDVGVKIAGALDAAYKQNLLHRDIKPANILFNADNEPKLVDFGLAREADKETEYGEQVWGTPEYSAPEKFKRESETFKSDMYSLGCALYQALTGRLPFEGPSVEEMVRGHVETPVTPPHEIVAEISPATSEAIVKALAKKPRDRFASYEEFVMALTAARSQVLVGQLAEQNAPAGRPARTTKNLGSTSNKAAAAPAKPAPRPAPVAAEAAGDSKKFLLMGALAVVIALVIGGVMFFKNAKKDAPEVKQAAAPATPTPAPTTEPAAEAKAAKKAAKAAVPTADAVAPVRPAATLTPLLGTDLNKNWMREDGRDLAKKGAWTLENGELSNTAARSTLLMSRQAFKDFDLLLEWKFDAGAGGMLIFGVQTGSAFTNALRIRIGDEPEKGTAKNAVGALAGVIAAPKEKTLKPPGEFNAMRVAVFGERVEVWLNGVRTAGFTLGTEEFAKKVAASPQRDNAEFGKTTAGHLVFQLPAGVTVRNLRIRGLTQMPAELQGAAPAKAKKSAAR